MKSILHASTLTILTLFNTSLFAADCGNAEQCFTQAETAMMNGQFDTAFTAAKSACEQGNGDACAVVGILYQLGQGVKANSKQSSAYLQKSCKLGSGNGCATLASAYFNGNLGLKKDLDQAYQLASSGCQAENALACMVLGAMQITGQGTKQDIAAGQANLDYACANEPMACDRVQRLRDTYKQRGILK